MNIFSENKWNNGIIGLTFLIASSLLFYYIHTYSVNIFFFDQWDFYNAFFFNEASWIDLFYWQHGPHRQGIGFIIQKYLDQLSNWDTYYTCVAIGCFLMGSTLLYLWTKIRLTQKIQLFDVIIILAVLSPVQFGLFTNTPNLSHGAIPAFLIALSAFSLTCSNRLLGYSLLTFINLNLLFTGFGIFMGAITPVLLLIQFIYAIQTSNRKHYLWFGSLFFCTLLSWYLFFLDYTLNTAASNFQFPHPRPFEYLVFIVVAFFKLFGFTKITWFTALLAGLITASIFGTLFHTIFNIGKNVINKKDSSIADIIILTLTGFSLLFIIYAAIGRVGEGMVSGGSSRYMSYLIPSLVGFYLYLNTNSFFNKNTKQIILSCYTVLLLGVFVFNDDNERIMENFYWRKTIWKETYLHTKNIERANHLSGNLLIYPVPAATQLQEKLYFLEENQLNLFNTPTYNPSIPQEIKILDKQDISPINISIDLNFLTSSNLTQITDSQYVNLILEVDIDEKEILEEKEVIFEFRNTKEVYYLPTGKVQFPKFNGFYRADKDVFPRNYILFANKKNIPLPKETYSVSVLLKDKKEQNYVRTGLQQTINW